MNRPSMASQQESTEETDICCPCISRGKCGSCKCKKSGCTSCRNPMCKFKNQENTGPGPSSNTGRRSSARPHPYASGSSRNDGQPSRNQILHHLANPEFEGRRQCALLCQNALRSMTNDEKSAILDAMATAIPQHILPFLMPARAPYVRVSEGPAPTWCICGQCIEMEKNSMNVCCGKNTCITFEPEFSSLCMQYEVIEVVNILNWSFQFNRDPSFTNSTFRNQSYRNFILWQFGKLGRGVRKVPPSCTVCRIRWRFSSEDGTYTGYESFEEDVE